LSEQPTLAPPGIFKAYDIRGLYGEEMDETTALAMGLLLSATEPAGQDRSIRIDG